MKTKIKLMSLFLAITPLVTKASAATIVTDANSTMQIWSAVDWVLPENHTPLELRRAENTPNFVSANFDFQSLDWSAGWSVTSATLTLTISGFAVPPPPEGAAFSIYAKSISAYNTEWAPGVSSGVYQNPTGNVLWKDTAGNDVGVDGDSWNFYFAVQTWESLGSVDLTLYDTTPASTTVTITLDASTVQTWLDNPSAFNGIALGASGDYTQSVQLYGVNSAFAPQLNIQFVPEPATIALLFAGAICLVGTHLRRRCKA